MKTMTKFFAAPYFLWLLLFVLAPLALIVYRSFFNLEGQVSLANYLSADELQFGSLCGYYYLGDLSD